MGDVLGGGREDGDKSGEQMARANGIHLLYNAWGQKSLNIDHVFYSGFKALEFSTIRDIYSGIQFISDHYPVAAVLEF